MHLPFLSRDKYSLYANTWKLYLFRFFINLYLIGPVFLAFYQDFAGLSFKYMMFSQAWYMFWIFILEISSGIFADYFGRKKTLIFATIINGIAIALYSLYPSFYLFLFAEFLWALAFVLFSGTDDALAYDSLKQINETHQSEKVQSRLESFAYFGILIATPLGSIIASTYSARLVMIIMAIPYIFALIIALTLKESKIENPLNLNYYIHNFKYELKLLKSNKILIALILDLVLLYVIIYPMIYVYQDILMIANLDLFYLGFVYAGWSILTIVFMNSYDIFENIFKSKRAFLIISGLAIALMYLVLVFAKSLPLIIITIIIGCSLGFARRPLLINYMNKHIPSHKRATLLSLVSMFETFILIFIIQLIGILSENYLSITMLVLGLLALFITLYSSVKEDHLLH